MARAPYSPDTIKRMRELTAQGKGINAIARELEWVADDVRRIGRKHQIELIEDVLAKPKKKAAPPVPEPVKTLQEDGRKNNVPTTPKTKMSTRALKDLPRNIYNSAALSSLAIAKFAAVGKEHGKTPGTIVGIVTDYVGRHGWADEFYRAALAEIEAQP